MKIKVLHSETQAEIKELNLSYFLREGESCFVGRSQNSGLSLDSPSVSRLHGKFLHQDGQYYFCDLGSSNGSIIQGELAAANQNYLLHPGDVLRIGQFILLLEAVPEQSEELPQTILGNVDATVFSAYSNSVMQTPEDVSLNMVSDVVKADIVEEKVIEAELIKETSALARLEPSETSHHLHSQTRALFAAINYRVLAELKAAGNLTRDTYLKAISKARESIEQERLIDPEQFEREAEKYWQSITRNSSKLGARLGSAAAKGASNLGQRLGAAAQAAWNEFRSHPLTTTPNQPNAELPPPLPNQPSDSVER